MALSSKFRALDERVLPATSSEARIAHGRQYGWLYLLGLGSAILTVCIWALATGHPVIFFMDVGIAVAYVIAAGVLFQQRKK